MKFKDLSINDKFIFTSESEWWSLGMTKGPWIKLSTRKYRPDTTPFTDDPYERDEHEFWVNRWNTVGSINTEVSKQ